MTPIDLSKIPTEPGVYFMKNEENMIIYIGKAKNLKKRVSSYFQKKHQEFKTRVLVTHITDIDFIVTNSEAEAFLLEEQLIKKHQPRYNIELKDSKSYPFIAIDYNEAFPRIYSTREKHRKGVKYFGPYPRSATARQLVDLAHKTFDLRLCTCKISSNEQKKTKPCLYYHIGKCPGYCQWNVSQEEYDIKLNRFTRFLSGRYYGLEKELKSEMQQFSEQLKFEKAGEIRDLLSAIEDIKSRQRVYLSNDKDIDVFSFFQEENLIFWAVLHFAEGRLIHKRVFKMEENLEKPDLLNGLMSRFYNHNPVPDRIYTPLEPEESEELLTMLQKVRGKKLELITPSAGIGVSLLKLAAQNARYEFLADQKMTQKELGLIGLKKALGLVKEPRRIEGYDIATIEGHWSVGACVSFFEGRPDKKNYRHFSMKYVEGQDDYAMLAETLFRRFRLDNSAKPDLIMIDGGKGQLNAAVKILVQMNIQIPVISLAKKEELIFLPNRPAPVNLPLTDPGLQVLMKVRDEVHRFANRLHNKLRTKRFQRSILEDIPGIGPKRRAQLLQVFGSIDAMKNLNANEIQKKGKVPADLANKIVDFLKEKREH